MRVGNEGLSYDSEALGAQEGLGAVEGPDLTGNRIYAAGSNVKTPTAEAAALNNALAAAAAVGKLRGNHRE